MKFRILVLSALFTTALLSGCLHDECTSEQTYVRFDPIYKPLSEMRLGVKTEAARAMRNPGKMVVYGNYLFINEKQEGIHVIDNTDPANPRTLAFWNIPGNVDMAIKDDFLYADQYIDLMTIDISDLQQPKEVCRAENVFSLFGFNPANGYLVDYNETEVTEKIKCYDARINDNDMWYAEGDVLWVNSGGIRRETSGGGTSLPASVGIAGSYARFGLADQYLYTVDNWILRSWSLASPSCPVRSDSILVGWNIETIFPYKDKLFVGSQNGVFIMNNSNPAHPVLEASFDHASGCDPVVCDDKYAYVTIHDGTTCNGTFNQLDIVGIEHLPNASLAKSYPMKRPFGLAVTNNYLFLCDDGLKIFDKTNPVDIKELSHISGMHGYDVIAFSDTHLLLIGDDGFFQYDVTDPKAPVQLSLIPVVK